MVAIHRFQGVMARPVYGVARQSIGSTAIRFMADEVKVAEKLLEASKPEETTPIVDNPKSFKEFWPHYLKAHSKKATRAVHYIGTTAGLAIAGAGLATGNLLLVPAGLLAGYAILFPSHFFIEKNKPATLGGHPFWSFLGDFKMYGMALTGKLKKDLARFGIIKPKETPPAAPAPAVAPEPKKSGA